MYRGVVTNIDTAGVWVRIAEQGVVGPLPWTGQPPAVGGSVLVADAGQPGQPDLIVLGTVPGTAATGWVTSAMIANGTIVDADINASAAIAQTKISGMGAWTTYEPTIGGWTKGDGTATGQYCQIGKQVTVRCQLLLSSTTVAAGLSFSLPDGKSVASGILTPATVLLNDVTDTVYIGVGWVSSSTLSVYSLGSSIGKLAAFSSTVPFTWANSDVVYATATYEAV